MVAVFVGKKYGVDRIDAFSDLLQQAFDTFAGEASVDKDLALAGSEEGAVAQATGTENMEVGLHSGFEKSF